jgi:crotonobetainyl-CoA:carnitine CoA-transferase CaiB-like acyl-CoA transferase
MIDVAQLDCMAALNMAITGYSLSGMLLWQLKERYPLGRGFGGLLQAGDGGWVRLASFSPRLIDSLKEHMGVEEVTMEAIQGRVAQMTRDEAVQYFVDAKVPVAPVYNVDDVVRDPHLHSRDMFVEVDLRAAGKVKVVNFPVKFSETPCMVRDAAPVLGQNDEELLRDLLGYDESKIDELKLANAILA